jgi:serine/threonine-protein kinase
MRFMRSKFASEVGAEAPERSIAAVLVGCSIAVACTVVDDVARAQPPNAAADDQAATAKSLFYEGRALMRDGNYALACPKLEESLRLDYGMGTEFNLADCNEKLGKIASAWSGFSNVATAARAQNQAAREKVARDRAQALEPRLPKLAIDVAMQPLPAHLEVKRDGVVIPASSFGNPGPVDPGPHQITATAPGRESWEGVANPGEGKTERITIPSLAPVVAAVAAPALVPALPVAAPAAAPPPSPAAPPEASFPEPITEQSTLQRTIGWVVTALGVAGIGVAAGFGIDSMQKREAAKNHCAGDACDATGVSLRDKAISSGNVATIAGIAGGAAALGGVVLVLTAPSGAPRSEVPTTSFRAAPYMAAGGGGLSLQGVFQ